MSAVSCIPYIFMTIDKPSSSRIEKLPSSYSSESARWKVLHEKKKKKKEKEKKRKKLTNVLFVHLPISHNFVHSTYATSLFQEGKFVKIILRVLVFLTSRDRAPLRLFVWMFHDMKLTPL